MRVAWWLTAATAGAMDDGLSTQLVFGTNFDFGCL